MSLTDLGGEVMRRKKIIPLPLPEPPAKPVPARTKRSESKRAPAEPEEAIVNPKIFEALRQWRRQKAAAMGGIPAYIVYPDRTLKELAHRAPQTEAELLEVRGIGAAKARQFGRETLAVIQRAGTD